MFYGEYLKINVKSINKHAAIDLIRFTPGGISRVELARKMGITRAAVTAIINDLTRTNQVREVEGTYPTGRKPIVLEINPNLGYVLGIDIGATHISMLIANFAAHIIYEVEIPNEIADGPEVCLARVNQLIEDGLKTAEIPLEKISAITVGVPGPVIIESGLVAEPPIMPGWNMYPIRATLAKRWGRPINLANDAELGALGEWAYGAGRGHANLAYIKVGRGIGAGLIINNKIYHGSTGSAAEIGHITISETGPICSCGNRGCLEALAGGKAISRKGIEAVQKGLRTELAQVQPVESISARDVIIAASQGDHAAQQILMDTGRHLGTAISSLVNLFNPSVVIIGGQVAQIGDLMLEPIRATVRKRSLKMASQNLRITTALLGKRSTGMGAVVEALSLALHSTNGL